MLGVQSVGLELAEGPRQQVEGLLTGARGDQIREHVVGGAEGGPQDEVAAHRQAGNLPEPHERGPADEGMALDVDPQSML